MKQPAYTAGVTGMYRKYLDFLFEKGPANYHVTEKDKKYLLDLEVSELLDFQNRLFELLDTRYPEVPEDIRTKKVLTEETEKQLVAAIEECKKK